MGKNRIILAVAILICSAGKICGQDTLQIFYDESWAKIENKEAAYYYSIAIFKNGLWEVKDYFAKNNQLQNCYYYSILDSVKQGHYVRYFQNGNKESEGEYRDNFRIGRWVYWYENGKESSEELYLSEIKDIRKAMENDSNLAKSRSKAASGYAGIRNGKSIWYHENGKKSTEEIYLNGRIQSLLAWNEEGKKEKIEIKDPYGNTEMPEFAGNWGLFLSQSLKYPADAREDNIQGKEVVNFAIGPDGRISDCKIVRSIGSASIDAESLRVIKSMSGLFKPGKAHNRKVKVYYTLPLNFKLQD